MSFFNFNTVYQQGMSGLLGTAGGAAGTGFAAPQTANIQQVTNPAQIDQAQSGVTNSLASQQALLAALQNQNGLANQNVAQQNMNGLQDQLARANGVGVQQGAVSGLQGVANQYQDIANGVGPNPAQAALNQATGQNVANQAALMAGQRGAGANAGLIARQAAQQGAATQQQAVGQAATMQANQQLAGLQGLSGAQQAIGGLGSGLTGQQQTAQANAANEANTIAGQQIGGTNALTQANLSNSGQLQNTQASQNNAFVSNQNNINSGNAGLATTNMQGSQGLIGGALNGAAVKGILAGGGVVQKPGATSNFAIGGPVVGPVSSFGQFLNNVNVNGEPPENLFASSSNPGAAELSAGAKNVFGPKAAQKPLDTSSSMAGGDTAAEAGGAGAAGAGASTGALGDVGVLALAAAQGGTVPARVSENEIIVPTEVVQGKDPGKATERFVQAVMSQKKTANLQDAKSGGIIKAQSPNEKAVKSGNSYSNDKIDANLIEKQIVLPRSITTSKDPVKAAGAFVERIMAKRRGKK